MIFNQDESDDTLNVNFSSRFGCTRKHRNVHKYIHIHSGRVKTRTRKPPTLLLSRQIPEIVEVSIFISVCQQFHVTIILFILKCFIFRVIALRQFALIYFNYHIINYLFLSTISFGLNLLKWRQYLVAWSELREVYFNLKVS